MKNILTHTIILTAAILKLYNSPEMFDRMGVNHTASQQFCTLYKQQVPQLTQTRHTVI